MEQKYIQHDTTENRGVEDPIPDQGSPATRLSTITEEPSDMTEDVLFRHDEQCAKYGCEQTVLVTDDLCELAWLHVQDSHKFTTDTLDTQAQPYDTGLLGLREEEPLELYYSSDMFEAGLQR